MNRRDHTFASSSSPQSVNDISTSTVIPDDDEEEEEDEDYFNDPNLFNNHAKLMKIKWTKEDLELANSSNFMESINYTTEMFLQDPKFEEAVQQPPKTDVQTSVVVLENILKQIEDQEQKCLSIYTECKMKPFWDQQKKSNLISQEQEEKITKTWTNTLDKFTATFKQAQMLREKRKSSDQNQNKYPDSDLDVEKLLVQFQTLNAELSAISQVLDYNFAVADE